ncbi:(4Fe-4S)-binding protein [Halodesulfurarchaeum formicicum]|uniref:(4Fe-4S)-binding protein n=1 Tax=Halodesulfurarchaeum formicicum TaxID=1873524 RepID=A0A1D8S4H0_9EURY|nr:LUD domain-containing protein [Halodesulfurarchaeum formicicum]AOW80235.1 (4Fe-4S)-binding protein [Halodesulfurarchaeum formicicum]
MTEESRGQTAAHIRDVMTTDGAAVNEQIRNLNANRYESVAAFDDYETCRERAREIKERAIENLPTLIETVTEQVEANGGHVHVATDGAAANRYVQDVLDEQAGETVVKSKSMTTEEIGLREHLAEAGADVFETDLGEFVIQLAEESPSHIVGPSLHKSREEIATLFNEQFDPDSPLETPAELTAFAREYLGERMKEADLGITGANFVLAESGSVVLVTNEGNARKSAVVPDTHVAVAGIEKLIPSIEELHPFLELIARSATGQDIAQYVSLLTPPVESPTLDFDRPDQPIDATDDDREFHLVLLDNGRTAMREDPHLRETLYCIRCGACLNSCANFQQVGGHAFGGDTYTGGIGTGWVAGLDGPDATAAFNDLCTSCSRCVPNCPVKIDIPWINTVVRDRRNNGNTPDAVDHLIDPLVPDQESTGLDRQKRFFGNIDTVLRLGSALAPVSNWALSLPGVDRLLESTVGIDRRRSLPQLATETFRSWWADHHEDPDSADTTVHLFVDLYTNYLYPERGKAAVRLLRELDLSVEVTPVLPSGRAPLSQGMITTATKQANEVAEALESPIAADEPVLVIEPSDLALFRSEYSKLLPTETAAKIDAGTAGILEYVSPLIKSHTEIESGTSGEIVFHSNCQQRTAGFEEPTVEALEALGYDVRTTDVECCGMAGSFGYKSQYYELSMAVGDDLEPQVADTDVLASGTSCVAQIGSLTDGDEPLHPVELVERAWAEHRS